MTTDLEDLVPECAQPHLDEPPEAVFLLPYETNGNWGFSLACEEHYERWRAASSTYPDGRPMGYMMLVMTP